MSQPPKKNTEGLVKEAQRASRPPPARRGGAPAPAPKPAATPDPNYIELDEPATAPAPKRTLPNRRGPTARVAPTSHQGGMVASSAPAVKEMQQAILNFAATAASTDVTSMTGNKSGLKEGPQTTTAPGQVSGKQLVQVPKTDAEGNVMKDPSGQTIMVDEYQNGQVVGNKSTQEHLGGSDPFGDFIVQQYVATDPVGSQYLNVDVSGKKDRAGASIDNSNLRGMIDTISRVGTPGVNGGEKSVDGVWAYRTDHALAGILSLTNAMLNFARDLKVAVTYSQQKLDAFKAVVPKVYTAVSDKGAAAKAITPFINEATQFFQELKKAVLTNGEIRQYIDQKKPFASYPKTNKKSVKDLLSSTEQSTFSTNQVLPLPNVAFVGVSEKSNSISLRELSDMESFKGFMRRIGKGKEAENPVEVKKMLDTVMDQLNASNITPSSKGAGY